MRGTPTACAPADWDDPAASSRITFPRRAKPAARVVDYAGHGHAMHWEDPARVAADVASFVRGLPASGPTERRAAIGSTK